MIEAVPRRGVPRRHPRYMQRHAYRNADSAELWDAIERASGKPMRGIAEDFTFPRRGASRQRQLGECARGERTCPSRQAGSRSTKLRACRSLGTCRSRRKRSVAAQPGGHGRPRVRDHQTPRLRRHRRQSGADGYYRTYYRGSAFAEVSSSLRASPAADQLGLFYDTRALGVAGLVPYPDAYDLAQRAPSDANPLVFEWIAREIAEADLLYADLPGRVRLVRTVARCSGRRLSGSVGRSAAARPRTTRFCASASLPSVATRGPGSGTEARRLFVSHSIPVSW